MFPLYKIVSGSSQRKSGSTSRLAIIWMKFRLESGRIGGSPRNPGHDLGHNCGACQAPGFIRTAKPVKHTGTIQVNAWRALLLKKAYSCDFKARCVCRVGCGRMTGKPTSWVPISELPTILA